jgi:hypothetical protein
VNTSQFDSTSGLFGAAIRSSIAKSLNQLAPPQTALGGDLHRAPFCFVAMP